MNDRGLSVASTRDGYLVVTGGFQGEADFGGRKGSTLVASGPNDGFIARYALDGELEGLARAGGDSPTEPDLAATVAALPTGGFVVAGTFSGTATFGTDDFQTTLVSAGEGDVFIARYNADGDLSWARRAGGLPGSIVGQVAYLPDGALAVVGFVFGPTVFGDGEANETTLTPVGIPECMIALFDLSGDLLWAQTIPSPTGFNGCIGVTGNASGEFAVVGFFEQEVTFGFGGPDPIVLDSMGGTDAFVAAYDGSGNVRWAHQSGGSEDDLGSGVVATPDGAWLMAGRMAGTAVFGAGEVGEVVATSRGETDVFLARYGADGTLTWVRQSGGPSVDDTYSLALVADGDALLAGYFSESAMFGDMDDARMVESVGAEDAFLARFDEAGTLVSVQRAGGQFSDMVFGLAASESGDVLATGYFSDVATFFPDTPYETTLTSRGGTDVFVARMPP